MYDIDVINLMRMLREIRDLLQEINRKLNVR